MIATVAARMRWRRNATVQAPALPFIERRTRAEAREPELGGTRSAQVLGASGAPVLRRYWLGLAALLAILTTVLIWSVSASASVKIPAQGILLSVLGIVDINAPSSGRIAEIRVQPGDMVRRGESVALLSQAETVEGLQTKQVALAGLQAERVRLLDFQERVRATVQALNTDREAGNMARIASLTQRVESLTDLERNTRSLVDKGLTLNARLLAVVQELTQAQDDLRAVRSQHARTVSEEETQSTRDARELLAIDLKIAGVKREIEVLTDRLSRTTVMAAPGDGRVVELTASVNDLVGAGRPVMRMLPSGGPETLQGVFYVPAEAGKRVRAGMAVQVVPANARLQRDGYIRARVVAVSELPATREGMQRLLKNETLVQQLTAKGPPYEVTVVLERDPASATGFAWSTGHGTAPQPSSGTTAEAKLVVERLPILGLVIPRIDAVLSWLRPAVT